MTDDTARAGEYVDGLYPMTDDAARHDYDHDGTFRHHHAAYTGDGFEKGEPVWWGACDQFGGEKRHHRHAPMTDDTARAAPRDHEHYWVDAYDDETGWHCTICGLTEYPDDPGTGASPDRPSGLLREALDNWEREAASSERLSADLGDGVDGARWRWRGEAIREMLHSIRAALATPDEPVAGLDAAWAEAEAALPDGWRVAMFNLWGDEVNGVHWRAVAETSPHDWKDYRTQSADAPTPAAALRALAARLREDAGWTPPAFSRQAR